MDGQTPFEGPKGTKAKRPYRPWSLETKLEYVKIVLSGEMSLIELARLNGVSDGLLGSWVKKFREGGEEALRTKRRLGNPLVKYQFKKELTPMEKLEYENLQLRIENMRLKKGYTNEEAMAAKQKRLSKRNTKSSKP